MELLYTFSGSHPLQAEYDDSVEYNITHNLGKRPMVYQIMMHRDDAYGGMLKFVNDSKSLNKAIEYGAFTVHSITSTTLSLVIYRAGLPNTTEDFTFNIYG